jgi:hypothetical protein
VGGRLRLGSDNEAFLPSHRPTGWPHISSLEHSCPAALPLRPPRSSHVSNSHHSVSSFREVIMSRWILAAVLLCGAARGDAAVISRDWKTPGDGLLTYDDINKREWLDLAESRLAMFSGTTLEQRFQNSLFEIGPGGLLDGFIVAKPAELEDLARSAGINVSRLDAPENVNATQNLIALVGHTVSNPTPGSAFSIGVLDELTSQSQHLKGQFLVILSSGPMGDAGLLMSSAIEPFQISGVGVWLVREVPEPASWISGIVGLLAPHLTSRFRCRHHYMPGRTHCARAS